MFRLANLVALIFFVGSSASNAFSLDRLLNCKDPLSSCYWDDIGENIVARLDPTSRSIIATRAFGYSQDFPPERFKAFGVLLFKNSASSEDMARHTMFCEAYVSAIPHISTSEADFVDQMVTIWPMASRETAARANSAPRSSTCEFAVGSYDVSFSLLLMDKIRQGEIKEGVADFDGRGPFLVAWSPTQFEENVSTYALFKDLSDDLTYERALYHMEKWREKIQDNRSLWEEGFQPDPLLLILRDFFDGNGAVLKIVF